MKNVYMIGIGGIGMSAIARYYNHAGYNVCGYDRTPTNLTRELENEGIRIHYTDDISFIPEEKEETLVIYTPAIPEELGELRYVEREGYRRVKRSQALGTIASDKFTLAVAGTHGKTTTSTLLAHIFQMSGTGCTAFFGGISKNYHTNLLLSRNKYLVAEADEFDRSFLQLYPDIAIITSIDADHLDIYGSVNNVREAFQDFASQVKKDGYLIVKKSINFRAEKANAKLLTYSFDEKADFYPENTEILEGGYYKFDLRYPEGIIKGCVMGIPGWINAENGIAAAAAALCGGIGADGIKKGLESFQGVSRRIDIHLNTPNLTYIDDYAHHPKEIASAISSIRGIFPGRKICGIFQPHLYSRTRDFAEEFAESLTLLDELILLEIYPARETPIPGVDSEIIFRNVRTSKRLIKKENLLEYLKNKELDILVTFGAGDIDRFVAPITDMLTQRIRETNDTITR